MFSFSDNKTDVPANSAAAASRYAYIGFSLMVAWNFCVWYVPQLFPFIDFLDPSVTIGWYIYLAAGAVTLFASIGFLGWNHRLEPKRPALFCIAIATSLVSAMLFLGSGMLPWGVTMIAAPIALGTAYGISWLVWFQMFANLHADFNVSAFAPAISFVLLVAITFSSLLPAMVAIVFVAAMPTASVVCLHLARRAMPVYSSYPIIQPSDSRRRVSKSVAVTCAVMFFASIACYYLIPTIRTEYFLSNQSYTICAIAGAIALLILYSLCRISNNRLNIFRMLPWLLVFIAFSYVLFLDGDAQAQPLALIGVGAVNSMLDVVLTMYFGVLVLRGYLSVPTSCAFCGGFVWAGTLLGDLLKYTLIDIFAAPSETVTTCAVVLLGLVMALVIPLVRQEYRLVALTDAQQVEVDMGKNLSAITAEFKLTAREAEVLGFLARGYSAKAIADKQSVSIYTVQAHTRHIYEKMGVHKRAELIDFIQSQNSSE